MKARSFWDPARIPKVDLVMPEIAAEGVADLTGRTARLVMLDTGAEFLESIERRWPWLIPEEARISDESDDGEDIEFEMFWAKGTEITGSAGRYTEVPSGGWARNDPFWCLDALAGADERTTHAGEDFVRGFLTSRYAFRADLKSAQAAAPGRFELPPHGSVPHPTVVGEAWIDGDGLLRQVDWTQPIRGRPRLRRRGNAPGKLWHTLELWDFGLPAQIEVPAAGPPLERPGKLEAVGDVVEAAWDFWRERRAWRRTHSAG